MPHDVAPRLSADDWEQELLIIWSRVFDLGGPHHDRTVRDPGTVHWVAEWIERSISEGADPRSIAAGVLWRIVREHPFMDCNHRTATFFSAAYLGAHGLAPVVSDAEIAEFTRKIDREPLDEVAVTAWIRRAYG